MPHDSGPGSMVYCRGCAAQIHHAARACPKCGAPQKLTPPKSKGVAALLALLLGGIGAHHFYLGNVGTGLVYLLFCWTLIPALLAFIEFLYYLCVSESKWAVKYG